MEHMSINSGELGSLEQDANSEQHFRWLCTLSPFQTRTPFEALAREPGEDAAADAEPAQPPMMNFANDSPKLAASRGDEAHRRKATHIFVGPFDLSAVNDTKAELAP